MNQDAGQILEGAKAALESLETLEDEFLSDIKDIRRKAARAGRQLTRNEKLECDILNSRLKDLYEAMRVISIENLKKIDDSDGVKALKEEIQNLSAYLNTDFQRLKEIDRYAKKAADVTNAFTKFADQLAKLAV